MAGSYDRITEVNDNDIICGRRGIALKHPGNLAYRKIVGLNKELYATCQKNEKLRVSKSIVAAMREVGGRFLEREDGKTSLQHNEVDADGLPVVWIDIGDKRAVEKTSQALREGQPKLLRQLREKQGYTTNDASQAPRKQVAPAINHNQSEVTGAENYGSSYGDDGQTTNRAPVASDFLKKLSEKRGYKSNFSQAPRTEVDATNSYATMTSNESYNSYYDNDQTQYSSPQMSPQRYNSYNHNAPSHSSTPPPLPSISNSPLVSPPMSPPRPSSDLSSVLPGLLSKMDTPDLLLLALLSGAEARERKAADRRF
jgi:hypothetical protein